MIKVFSAVDTLYSTNGDIVIQPTKARVFNADNGDFYLELSCSTDYSDYIQANNIIVTPTPQGEQAFRIRTVTKTKKKLEVKAFHVYYDTQNYAIQGAYVTNVTCNTAINYYNEHLDNTSPYTVASNIGRINSLRIIRKSFYECINEIVDRWGGHLYRDNWNISILASIGVDNGITIEYKKNLQELNATYDWSNVVTKLMPVGKDGILLDEIYIYSDIQYNIPYTKILTFEQDINAEDYASEEAYEQALKDDLLAQARQYINVYCLPNINYTLKGNPEKVTNIGDTIQVKDERIGVNVTTEVIAYEYDAIQEKYVTLEFGNFNANLGDLISTITANTSESVNNAMVTLTSELSAALAEAQDRIWNALGSSYVIYEGDKILVVDRLPKDRAVNVIRINSAGIAFSNTGINGTFTTAWTIDGTFNAQAINVINFTADLIKGGTLKLGSTLNQSGKVEVYDEANTLICTLDKNGLIMYAANGSYVVLNQNVGLVGYDGAGNPIYWVTDDEFHMSKSVVEQEITLCNKVRFLPMQITEGNVIVNDGIGLVSYYDE